MPTISQLPAAVAVSASDEMPISQGGSLCAVQVGNLLSSAQPVITVDSPSLIGRTSLGSGGPEQVDVGVGLYLSAGTVVATGSDHATYPATQTLLADADLVISNQGSQMLMATDLLRGLFSAGQNITIDSNGVIGAAVEGTVTATTLPGSIVSSAAAGDLIPITQSGTSHAIAYADFLDGITIDQAPAASAVSNTDSVWVAQGTSTLVSQSFGAIWTWIARQLPSYAIPTVEITTNSNLQAAVHAGRVLVCSQPVTLTALNMTSGFQCQVLNLSSGSVTFGTGFLTSSGGSALPVGQSAGIQCVTYSGGTIVYVALPQTSTVEAVPGQVVGLAVTGTSSSSLTLGWAAPTTGGATTSYSVFYRLTGTTTWTVASSSTTVTTYAITGLQAATGYDLQVQATNASGTGAASTLTDASTAAAVQPSVPGQVTGVVAASLSSTSVQLSWTLQTGSGAATSYTLQYRLTGTTPWTTSMPGITGSPYAVSGLTASTSYDFSLIGVNANGAGPISAIVSAMTQSAAASVSAITWNLAPSVTYAHGTGAIGVNAHVTPSTSAVQFGFSTSATTQPTSWTAGELVNTDLWGAYVATPAVAGNWYAWVEGTDGSCPTVFPTSFVVQ